MAGVSKTVCVVAEAVVVTGKSRRSQVPYEVFLLAAVEGGRRGCVQVVSSCCRSEVTHTEACRCVSRLATATPLHLADAATSTERHNSTHTRHRLY